MLSFLLHLYNKTEIQEINRTYRDKDKVTDVISFALEEDEPDIDF